MRRGGGAQDPYPKKNKERGDDGDSRPWELMGKEVEILTLGRGGERRGETSALEEKTKTTPSPPFLPQICGKENSQPYGEVKFKRAPFPLHPGKVPSPSSSAFVLELARPPH